MFNPRSSGGFSDSVNVEPSAVPSEGYKNDALGVVDAVVSGIKTSGVESTETDNAAFKTIFSLFGSGRDQEAHIGLPGIGFGSRPSSLHASEIVAKDANVVGFNKSKDIYESKHFTSGDSALNIEKTDVNGGHILESVKSLLKNSSKAVKEYEGIKVQAQKSETKAAFDNERNASGVAPVLDSSPTVNISPLGAGEGYNNDKIYAQKFSNKAMVNAKGAISGSTNVFSGVINVFGCSSRKKIVIPKAYLESETSSLGAAEGYEKDKIYSQEFTNEAKISADAISGSTKVFSLVINVFGCSSSQKANDGLTEVDLLSGNSSSRSVEGFEHDKVHAQKSAHNVGLSTYRGASEVTSVSGSSQKLEAGFPSFSLEPEVVSSKTAEGYEDEKIVERKFSNNAVLSAKGNASGMSSVFRPLLSQKSNAGVSNFGIVSGSGSLPASGAKISAAEFINFDVSNTSHSLIGSKIGEEAVTTANADLKVGAADVDIFFGSSIGQKAKIEVPGIDVLPGVSSSVATAGAHAYDKSHLQRFKVKRDISTKLRPIALEMLTSQKQKSKDGFF